MVCAGYIVTPSKILRVRVRVCARERSGVCARERSGVCALSVGITSRQSPYNTSHLFWLEYIYGNSCCIFLFAMSQDREQKQMSAARSEIPDETSP